MRRIGIHGAGFVPISSMGACPGGAVTPWYLSGGIAAANCLAAYTPKGAANLAASYDNNAAPGNGLPDGTYDAAPGVAPTHNPLTGWTFNGTTQYLTTGIVPTNGWSAFVQWTGAVPMNLYIFGSLKSTVLTAGFAVRASTGAGSAYWWNGGRQFGTFAAAGNHGFCGQVAYENGGIVAGAIPAWVGVNPFGVFIGALNYDGGPLAYFNRTIVALAIYSTILTGPQAVAVSTAMAAL